MFSTRGIETVASITEVRTDTARLLDKAKSTERGILVQKNNEPLAVLLSHEFYLKLLDAYEGKKG